MCFDGTFPSFLLGDTRCVDFFLVLERPICLLLLNLIHLRTRFISNRFMILPLSFSMNNFSSQKLLHYILFVSFQQLFTFPLVIAVINAFQYHIKVNSIDC